MVKNKNFYSQLIFFLITFYVIINTGIHSDDYTAIDQAQSSSWSDHFEWSVEKRGQNFFGIFNHYLFYWAYEVFTYDDGKYYDILKILINYLSFYLVYLFVNQYLNTSKSIIFSLFFVFSFIHDSSIFWYMTSPYIFTAAMIMFSHYLINNKHLYLGSILLTFSSLLSYSSPPYIFGLSLIFLLEKKNKEFIIFNCIGFFYLFYYFYFGILSGSEIRIENNIEFYSFFKNLIIQFFSSIDSLIGVSFFLKYYYSILNIDIVSIIIITAISIFFYKFNNVDMEKSNYTNLLLSFVSVFILSLCMFSLTGLYAQSSFNLGNRVTIYGCLLFCLLLTLMVRNKTVFIFLLILILLPLFGLSNYWKKWNDQQISIIKNINNNEDLKNLDSDTTIIITNNLYHKLGKLNHIEFLIQPWVVRSIFKHNVKTESFMALTGNTKISKKEIVNLKFNEKIKLNNEIYIYNTNSNSLKKINFEELKNLLNDTDYGKRHWLQLINNKKINTLIISLSPRLGMYFK